MKLTLQRLTLRNFKGQRDLTLDAAGADLSIWGDNSVGKTTIADAFFWLLFDKDSANRKDFEVKTLDPETGKPFQGLDHEVEAELELPDGKRLTLRKVYRENWVKQRGQAERTFTGHSTDYFVNTVPVQKKEYDERVRSICDETRFRLLTDPAYFNTVMPWQDRRKVLLQVCGDVTDEQVIASRKSLEDLTRLLGGLSLEEYRKVAQAKRREINAELDRLPVRIDEATRSIPTETAVQAEDLEALRAELAKLQEERARLQSGGEIAEQTKRLAEVETKLAQAQTGATAERNKKFDEIHTRLRAKTSELTAAQGDVTRLEQSKAAAQEKIDRLGFECDQLREQFRIESAKNFEFTGEKSCAACGQALPADKVEAARAKAEEEFNAARSMRLEANRSEGKTKVALIAELKAEQEKTTAAIEEAKERIAQLTAERDAIEAEGQEIQSQPIAQVTDEALLAEKAEIEGAIQKLRFDAADALGENARKIQEVEQRIAAADAVVARKHEAERAATRIAELEEQHTKLNAEYALLEKALFLTEEFIRAKVDLLEEKINQRFTLARFKLFAVQVNGGLEECCEVTFNGVPYGSLNHGARLNVGLDIINSLAEHYGFAPPVVIDNAESVTSILPTVGQQIRLVVSAADKTLRIEKSATEGKSLSLAI